VYHTKEEMIDCVNAFLEGGTADESFIPEFDYTGLL